MNQQELVEFMVGMGWVQYTSNCFRIHGNDTTEHITTTLTLLDLAGVRYT